MPQDNYFSEPDTDIDTDFDADADADADNKLEQSRFPELSRFGSSLENRCDYFSHLIRILFLNNLNFRYLQSLAIGTSRVRQVSAWKEKYICFCF